jgi:superfamily II DNA/RNA helicase
VEDVKFVINFDYPSSSEDYVHRIGRTGRSQRTGTAYTFFTPGNARQASDLVAVLREANQVINPKLYEMAEMSKGLGGRGNGLRQYLRNYFVCMHARSSVRFFFLPRSFASSSQYFLTPGRSILRIVS